MGAADAVDGLHGEPTFYHLHVKRGLPPRVVAGQVYNVTVHLSNEMDVYIPHAAHAACGPLTVNVACHPVLSSASHPDPTVSVQPPSKPLLGKTGRGSFDIALSAACPSPHSVSAFYLHLSVSGALSSSFLPAVSGPHELLPHSCSRAAQRGEEGAAEQEVLHAVTVAGSASDCRYVLVKEVCGSFIGGRVWDCSLYLMRYVSSHILQAEASPQQQTACSSSARPAGSAMNASLFLHKRILELGSGTGVFGLWLAASLSSRLSFSSSGSGIAATTQLVLTDQPEAMPLLAQNLQRNSSGSNSTAAHTAAAAISISSHLLSVSSAPLLFGDREHLQALQSQLPVDLVVASDVVFNAAYFTALLQTLSAVMRTGSRALFSYRPRGGLGSRDDAPFWKGLTRYGLQYEVVQRYDNVYIVWMLKVREAEAQGSERLSRRQQEQQQLP